MGFRKFNKRKERYLPLSDIEKIDDMYLTEMERVKQRLGYVKDQAIIQAFHDVLLSSYNAAIELRAFEREVDYDIKLAEIRERERNIKPFRRCWLWRLLLFFPLTNRAQDIIEVRAELEADIIHTSEEKAIEDDRKKLPQDDKKQSAHKLKREMKKTLKEIIKRADNADVREAIAEPQQVAAESENTTTAEQSQMGMDELMPIQTRKPRPPRSCRRA